MPPSRGNALFLRCVCVLGVLARTSWTFAGEPARRVDLVWQNDGGCIDQGALAAMVESALERPVFHADARPAATIRGEVRAIEGGFEARVGDRIVRTTGSCDKLDESVAVVVAIMVDSIPEPPQVVADPTPIRIPERPIEQPRAIANKGGSFELGSTFVAGLLPNASVGVQGRGAFEVGRFSIGAGASGLFPSAATHARIWAWSLEADVCLAPVKKTAWRIDTCAIAGGGGTHAHPIGLVGDDTDLPHAFAGLAIDFGFRLAPSLWIGVRPHARAMLAAPIWTYGPEDTRLGASWPIALGIDVGLTIRPGS